MKMKLPSACLSPTSTGTTGASTTSFSPPIRTAAVQQNPQRSSNSPSTSTAREQGGQSTARKVGHRAASRSLEMSSMGRPRGARRSTKGANSHRGFFFFPLLHLLLPTYSYLYYFFPLLEQVCSGLKLLIRPRRPMETGLGKLFKDKKEVAQYRKQVVIDLADQLKSGACDKITTLYDFVQDYLQQDTAKLDAAALKRKVRTTFSSLEEDDSSSTTDFVPELFASAVIDDHFLSAAPVEGLDALATALLRSSSALNSNSTTIAFPVLNSVDVQFAARLLELAQAGVKDNPTPDLGIRSVFCKKASSNIGHPGVPLSGPRGGSSSSTSRQEHQEHRAYCLVEIDHTEQLGAQKDDLIKNRTRSINFNTHEDPASMLESRSSNVDITVSSSKPQILAVGFGCGNAEVAAMGSKFGSDLHLLKTPRAHCEEQDASTSRMNSFEHLGEQGEPLEHLGEQGDPIFLEHLENSILAKPKQKLLALADGGKGHSNRDMIVTFRTLWHDIMPGGVYFANLIGDNAYSQMTASDAQPIDEVGHETSGTAQFMRKLLSILIMFLLKPVRKRGEKRWKRKRKTDTRFAINSALNFVRTASLLQTLRERHRVDQL
ncbi:unnamed protein product [Amoebophrya sp. A25]|nr:unnamed protein product [Amoebophrya sp. A25]|eukprot:GSA25T00025907001.1